MEEKGFEDQQFAELLFELGNAYMERNQVDAAIEKYHEFLSISDENDEVITRLSDAYLSKQADDDEACTIYRKALRLLPKNYFELLTLIIRIEFQKGHYSDMESLSEKELLPFREDPEIIPLYAHIGWQLKAYAQVANAYKLMMAVKFNTLIQKWLMLNYIKAAQHSDFVFGLDDLLHCFNYIKSVRNFERLRDIHIYLLAKGIIREYFHEDLTRKQKAISEFEFFLENNVVSTKLDRVLNKKIKIDKNFSFFYEIWDRSNLIVENGKIDHDDIEDDQKAPHNAFSHYPVLLYIHVRNYKHLIQSDGYKLLLDEFDVILHSTFDRETAKYVKRVNDGYLIIGDDVAGAAMASSKLIKKYLSLKKGSDSRLHLSFGLHFRNTPDSTSFLTDLITFFEIAWIETDEAADSNHGKNESADALLITETAKAMLGQSTFEIKAFGEIHIPLTGRKMGAFSVEWSDGMDILRSNSDAKIGRFSLMEEIGENEFCVTYKAIDTYLERLVIIKVLRPELIKAHEDDFMQGATRVAKLNHENVSMIYDVGKDQGFAYIAREYIEGNSFAENGSDLQIMRPDEAVALLSSIGDSLTYAHRCGVYHGGLKPSNLFKSNQGSIRLTDFAPFQFSHPAKSRQFITVYELSYMSPQCVAGRAASMQDDIYGLGLLLVKFLTGINPFLCDTKQGVFSSMEQFRLNKSFEKSEGMPDAFRTIVVKALSTEYESIESFMKDLHQAI